MTHKTGQDLIDEAKQQIEEVTPEQVRARWHGIMGT